MDAYFYLDQNGQQQGPIAANELPNYGVTRNTQVWKQGMNNWQLAGSIPELSHVLPPQGIKSIDPQLQKPDNLMVWSILVTLLCFLPTGIAAIIYSNKVDTQWNAKDYDGARQAAKNAGAWCLVSLGLAVTSWLIAVVSFYAFWAALFGIAVHH